MQLQTGIGTGLFPGYSAALTLVKDHSVEGAAHAVRAMKSTTGTDRLTAALRTVTSLDHAIDNVSKLPVQLVVRNAGRILAGYEAAKQAVNLLVQSGVIPGAREQVGRQSLLAARAEFEHTVSVNAADRSRYGAHLAYGWLRASHEDSLAGLALLQRDAQLGRTLVAGLEQARAAVQRRTLIDGRVTSDVLRAFDRADAHLLTQIESASARALPAAAERELFAQVDALLAVAAQAG